MTLIHSTIDQHATIGEFIRCIGIVAVCLFGGLWYQQRQSKR